MTLPTRPENPPTHTLSQVVAWLREQGHQVEVTGPQDVSVRGISLSSQRIEAGDLYAALPGRRVHGMDFVADATAAGAVAALTDADGSRVAPEGVPTLIVDDPRSLLGGLAAFLYADPAAALAMVGVTGTQGKTTCTRLLDAGLNHAGVSSAVIGTNGTRVAGVDVKTSLTTPEAPDLQALFAMMRERQVQACAMEVSSHALVLGRVDGVVFDVAVFLNLGRDHLDFHPTVEDYFAAKAGLFTPERARTALVNADDEFGQRLIADPQIPTQTFSLSDPNADWHAHDVAATGAGSSFVITERDGVTVQAGCSLPGEFNISNTLAAVAAAALAGFDPQAVADGIAASPGVPGRLERIDEGQDFEVIVDYAHKPDALTAVIQTMRPLTTGRVIVVLGAGGERDTGKRPLMGEIAARLADVFILTDDNPRGEDPAQIRAEVSAGIDDPQADVREIGDRGAAIHAAIEQAQAGDIVLIAGKGHESGQEINGVVHPFDDRAVAREALAETR